MTLRAGRLNKRVTIQANTPTQDTFGEEVDSWAAITGGQRWAAIEPLRGRERFDAQQVNPTVSHKVTIRFLSTVEPAMRVLFGTRKLQIDAVVDPQERGEMMELYCTENPDA